MTRESQNLPDRCTSAASHRRTPITNGKGLCSAVRKLSRSAATASGVLDQLAVFDVDNQFYPDGVPGAHGGWPMRSRTAASSWLRLLGQLPDGYLRAPVRLDGGDCSTDSFCYPSVLNLSAANWTPAWLWLAVIASAFYHGVNPGMGWPLAVSAGLMERSPRAAGGRALAVTAGHLLAMLLVILPFALLVTVSNGSGTIQIVSSLLVIAFGLYRLANRASSKGFGNGYRRRNWDFGRRRVALAHGAA